MGDARQNSEMPRLFTFPKSQAERFLLLLQFEVLAARRWGGASDNWHHSGAPVIGSPAPKMAKARQRLVIVKSEEALPLQAARGVPDGGWLP